MRNYLFEYDMDGVTYGFSIYAKDFNEALDKKRNMTLARFSGECYAEFESAPTLASRSFWRFISDLFVPLLNRR